MKIQLMNIARQHEEHESEFDEAVLSVLHSGEYIGGHAVKTFEINFAKIIGAEFCVSCGNGTDALVLALRALGIGVGDEVITVAFTFFATAESISAVGATPVFIDVDKESFCMNPNLIENAITPRTKAILPVHIYGNVCDMDLIMNIAKKHSLFVVEDCAQATLCKYKGRNVGTIGDIGCFSFFPTKIMGCAGDGGAVITNNNELAKAIRSYKTHGSGLDGFHTMIKEYKKKGLKMPADLIPEDDKYHNYLIGYNSRLDAIQAALLNVKLKYANDYIERRRNNANHYLCMLKDSSYILPKSHEYAYHGYYVFAVIIENSEEVIGALSDNGIEVHTYYPIPLHLQGAYAFLNYKKGDLPITEWLSSHSFAIPVYPEITISEMDAVIKVLKEYGK
jgi:dTDP-4-amino-4,6-dideoxygalactose transaminase